MPIAFHLRRINDSYGYCPAFLCDCCGKPITDPANAVVDYPYFTEMGASTDELRFFHNGHCAGRKAPRTLSIQLDRFISQLIHNSKFKERDFIDF